MKQNLYCEFPDMTKETGLAGACIIQSDNPDIDAIPTATLLGVLASHHNIDVSLIRVLTEEEFAAKYSARDDADEQ